MPVRRRRSKSKGGPRIGAEAIDAFRQLKAADVNADEWWRCQVELGDLLGIGPDQSFPQIFDDRMEPIGWEWPAIAIEARNALEAALRGK